VRSILKALGLSIWGAIAILLSVIFIVVGYEAASKYHASRSLLDLEKESNTQTSQSQPADSAASVALPDRAPDLSVPEVVPRAAEGTDCANAPGTPRIALDSRQRARIARLLDNSEAAKSESGDAFVRLGELYYGFGEYELAVAAIERGLEKGRVSHSEEAYVYLGRSEVALGDLEAARDAFAKLQDVPGISPNVLRLWTLYAETHLTASKIAPRNDGECQKSGAGQ
jgi:tetratricopeptide (TPR) repeat protein